VSSPASSSSSESTATLFKSFWMGGFEGACHVNRADTRVDLIRATQHDVQALSDYRLARTVGIETLRDGVRWPLVESRPGHYDFSSFLPMLRASLDADVQVIWTLCHYGLPDELDIFSPAFPDRFAAYARAVALVVGEHTPHVPCYTPVNEISFLAWAAGGAAGFIHPHAAGRANELKQQLVRGAIAAMDAIWDVDPRARFLHVDPVIHVIPPRRRPQLANAAAAKRESQFEAWDMLAGRRAPELGGAMKYLDVMGLNFYHSNEWEHPRGRLRWEDEPRDERWVPLHKLMAEVFARYQRPICLGETSHFGIGRARWIREIGAEVAAAIEIGVPVEGVCLYPLIDRPDWDDPNHWHNSGLFDIVHEPDGTLRRVLNHDYAVGLGDARAVVERARNATLAAG
jgi:beta-glucosidase/6-phospho-beta-glucosidase/beta-galactosidase